MIRSFAENHMDQVYFDHKGIASIQAGEAVWTLSHQNVMNFLQDIPNERQFHLKFEDLVSNPQIAMTQLCSRFGWEFHPEMIDPYRDKDRKIPGGIRPESKGFGDPKFHSYSGIKSERAIPSNNAIIANSLCSVTRQLAKELGYSLNAPGSQEAPPKTEAPDHLARAKNTRSALQSRRERLSRIKNRR